MRTIRQNCFETNSSSTHSITVCSIDKASPIDVTFIPNEKNEIHLSLKNTNYQSATPHDKTAFALMYAKQTGDQALWDRIIDVIQTFTGATLLVSDIPTNSSWQRGLTEDDDDYEDNNEMLLCEFYAFCTPYSHESVEEFVDDVDEIFKTDDNIKTFIFSSKQGFHLEPHNDNY